MSETTSRSPGGAVFWTGAVLGASLMVFGVWTLFQDTARNHLVYTAVLTIGANVAHDAVIAPAVCAVGRVLTRAVPSRMRTQVTWGLFTSAMVVLVGLAPLTGFGRHPDNPTVLPLDYTTAVATVLGVVWVIAFAWILLVLRKK